LHATLTSEVDQKESYQGRKENVNLISKNRRIKKSPSLHCDVTNLEAGLNESRRWEHFKKY